MTETGRQQNNASPASDVPTKLETLCRAARTPSREECSCKYQIRRRYKTARSAPAPPPMPNSRRPPQARPKQPREYLRCAQCGSDPAFFRAISDHGLMQHMGQKHGGQQVLPESVGQLRRLDRAACVVCGTIRSQRCNRCHFCNSNTPLCELRVGDTFRDRRQPGHQNAAPGAAAADQPPPQRSQPVPPGDPLDDSPRPNCPIRDTVFTERDKQQAAELRRASAMALPRCVVSRYTAAWAESLEGTMSGHQSWALLCRYRCRLLLAEIPKGVDRNSEWKLRLHLWETLQISDLICKVLGQQKLWSASQKSKERCSHRQTHSAGNERAP